jgi:hypothetical protein
LSPHAAWIFTAASGRRLRIVLAILAALNFSGASSVRSFDKEN